MRLQFLIEVGIQIGWSQEATKTGDDRVKERRHALLGLQDAADHARDTRPVLGFGFQLHASGLRDRVELCLAIVV